MSISFGPQKRGSIRESLLAPLFNGIAPPPPGIDSTSAPCFFVKPEE